MARDIFGEVVHPPKSIGNKSVIAIAMAMLAELTAVATMIVVPLLIVGVIPQPPSVMAFFQPPDPPSMPVMVTPRTTRRVEQPNAAPTEAPREIRPEPEIQGGFERDSDFEGTTMAVDNVVLEPPPAARTRPPVNAPVRIGGAIRQPLKTRDVHPVYPAVARAVGIEGIVIVEAVIGADGTVTDARVLRSVPLLDQAALDAVRQWEFTPTLLNGQPVPVVMTVTVRFALR